MTEGPSAIPRRILYIDDDEGVCRLAERRLTRLGYAVDICLDGLSGIARLGQAQYDLVVLDYFMPGLDGLSTLERIRGLEGAPPVVFVTGSEDSRIAVAALKAGAADYVVKESSDSFQALLGNAIEHAIGQVELRQAKERADAALLLAKEAAERASQAKGRLLAAASHDLRQPLQVISLALDRVEMGPASRQETAVQRARHAITVLERAFNAFLDAARLESGAAVPRRQNVALGPLLLEVADEWLPSAVEKDLRLRVVPTRDVVDSDPEMLRTILRNLIGNAIKYTDRGGVLVGCRRRGAAREIQVIDSGLGIAAAELPHVFDEFRQAVPNSRGGLGLGLSIVQRSAAMLGHQVTVRSTEGSGSCFALRIDPAGD